MKKSGKGLTALIVLLCLVLAVVIAVIVFKQYEYGVSAEYYQSLRTGALDAGRLLA